VPALRQEIPSEAVSAEGLIRLDVTVTDEAGNPAPQLSRANFTVVDNGQPQKIVAFRASDDVLSGTDESLSVIFLLDTLELPPELASFERQQIVDFLRQNAGHLAQPVTIYSLEDSGFFLAARPSVDGNALAAEVASDAKIEAYFLAPKVPSTFKAAPPYATFYSFPALTGLRALGTIATAEDSKLGRKVLLWVGPTLPDVGTGAYISNGRGLTSYDPAHAPYRKYHEALCNIFEKISWFSTLLRQSRVTIDCFSIGEVVPGKNALLRQLQLLAGAQNAQWKQFLASVSSAEDADWMDLYKKVLADESGGKVLTPSQNLVRQMNQCVKTARTAYTLTFNPPLAAHIDEYHSLKIELGKPGLTARTSTGYYDQPFYDDPPNPVIRPVSVAQLEQILRESSSSGSKVEQLSALMLTERLSGTKLKELSAKLHGKLRELLEMIADESAFLDPPSSEVPTHAPPDPVEQQRILAAAADYLGRVIPKLPDFFATKTTVNYREVAPYPGLDTAIAPAPLHEEQRSKDTVLYRHGDEIAEPSSRPTTPEDEQLKTYGDFGPILTILQAALNVPGLVTWKSWEQGVTRRNAVIRVAIAGNPSVYLAGCCYPDGSQGARIGISAGSHGEIVVDPSSGAILRAQLESDLQGFVPTKRSDNVVNYGPVTIGGNTYILPQHSIHIWRGRTEATLTQWNIGFPTWGPYETHMNVFTFERYHKFQGNLRMLPGFTPSP
jgi:VWFA-related protein